MPETPQKTARKCSLSLVFILLLAGLAIELYNKSTSATIEKVAQDIQTVIADLPVILKQKPVHFLHPSRYAGDGVTKNAYAADNQESILISGFFADTGQQEIRLIKRDGTLVTRWPVFYTQIFPDPRHYPGGGSSFQPPQGDWNIDLIQQHALPDGAVIFLFTGMGGMVKMDRCGQVVWTLPELLHHSIEKSSKGGYWSALYVIHKEALPDSPFLPPYQEPYIVRISEDGKIVQRLSLREIMYENGLEALYTAGVSDLVNITDNEDVGHLNEIYELTSDLAPDFPMFETGDLVVSVRDLNTVMVLSPSTRVVKWIKTGPWLRQHSARFMAGGKIRVFNNNTYATSSHAAHEYALKNIQPPAPQRTSNIMDVDVATGAATIAYGNLTGEEMLSLIRGSIEILPNNNTFITETISGRAFEVTSERNIVWEYVNRYNDTHSATIDYATVYPAGYFEKVDWSACATDN